MIKGASHPQSFARLKFVICIYLFFALKLLYTYFIFDLLHLFIVCSCWELKAAFVKSRLNQRTGRTIKQLKLFESTYNLCGNDRKERLGVKGLTNSQLAEILLHEDLYVLSKDARGCTKTVNVGILKPE